MEGKRKVDAPTAPAESSVRTLLVIGIGAGSPEHLTLQAVDALRRLDVVFFLDKAGPGKDALVAARRAALARARPEGGVREVVAESPERDWEPGAYRQGIARWRDARLALFRRFVTRDMGEGEVGGLLVWGDPCLYDGTLQILDDLIAEGVPLDYQVIPGISAVQALTARHRLPLNRIGEPIAITTARQLADAEPSQIHNTVVMLDGRAAFRALAQEDLEIYWGAYLGTQDEVLVAGRLADKAEEIAERIEAERARHGWIMDTYLLRRPKPA
jgi:precorrin-6A synthase